MKDYHAVYEECRLDLKKIGIRTPDNITLKVNTRAKTRLGAYCRYNGTTTIEISNRLIEDDAPDLALKDTIIHELLHSVTPGEHHGGMWSILASKVRKYYPELHMNAVSPTGEYGLRSDTDYKYILKCTSCGKEYGRRKMSRAIMYPERYHCKCGGDLILVKG